MVDPKRGGVVTAPTVIERLSAIEVLLDSIIAALTTVANATDEPTPAPITGNDGRAAS